MRISKGLPAANWQACAAAARQAEEDGADAVTASELKHDPFTPLAFAALATERVALVPSVAIAFPRSPMVVANLARDINRHSKGRFVVASAARSKPITNAASAPPGSPPPPGLASMSRPCARSSAAGKLARN